MTHATISRDLDCAVIGGGLVGAALAWGLAGAGVRVAVLDEGDVAHRAARGNFALIWVQGKGVGLPPYARWTARSAAAWPQLAELLRAQTGIDVGYRRPGGLHLLLSAQEWERRVALLRDLAAQTEGECATEMLARAQLERLLPGIGPEVVGASFDARDGHCDSLRLLRALHLGAQRLGTTYLADHAVQRIDAAAGGFRLTTRGGELRAQRVVLAAGLGNARLAPMVGLAAPVRPQRGQILVTERCAPFLSHPTSTLCQTGEGSVLLGDSQEEVGCDERVDLRVLAAIAARAVRMLPQLARLNVVRAWAALRVLTPDGFPIYERSAQCPGAFLVTCHSGVTLAAVHALALAPAIAAGTLPAECAAFAARRFDVRAAA
jgi:glycine/D-amino acid oxidase-like deaminating enzyme